MPFGAESCEVKLENGQRQGTELALENTSLARPNTVAVASIRLKCNLHINTLATAEATEVDMSCAAALDKLEAIHIR